MLGEFAKRIDAEVQLMIKRHRHAQQQHKGGVATKGPTDVRQKVNEKISVDSSSSRAPASAWSERKR
jgi:hypothetical protein